MQPNIIVLSQGPYHVAVWKPHNLAVVGGPGVVRPTLLDLMRKMFGNSIFPVHRLDRVTAGITIFARSQFAKHAMENAFKKRLVKKTYYALCEGKPSFQKKTVDESLKKIELDKRKSGPQAKQTVDKGGEKAITNFIVLNPSLYENMCLIEAQPISGRMHQIRAHLAFLGLPIVGDNLYGAVTHTPPHSIALCAVMLDFPLPRGERLKLDARHLFDPQKYLGR